MLKPNLTKTLALLFISSVVATSHAVDYRMTLVSDIVTVPDAVFRAVSEDGTKLIFGTTTGRGGYYDLNTHQVKYIEMLPGEGFAPFRITADGTIFGHHRTADFSQHRGVAIDLNTDQRSYFDYAPAGFDVGGLAWRDVYGNSRLISRLTDALTGSTLSAIYTKRADGQWTTDYLDPVSRATGFDEEGNIYGSRGEASIWDPNLVRRGLISSVNGLYCHPLGRLPNGKIVGKVSNAALTSYTGICTWDNEQASPVILASMFLSTFQPTAVSPTGAFAFYNSTSNTQTFLWDPISGLRNMKDAVINEIAGTEFTGVDEISDSGKFVCGTNRGLALIEPVPEPGTVAVLGFGLVSLLRRKRKPK